MMNLAPFLQQNNRWLVEGCDLNDVARRFGTPCYVYSARAIAERYLALSEAFGYHPHRVCYAVKANSHLQVLYFLHQHGAYFDIVSGGELERLKAAGISGERVVFSGVGKSASEMHAGLNANIACFNVESEAELLQLHQVAQHENCIAPIALRMNPNIPVETHPFLATGGQEHKFGIDESLLPNLYEKIKSLPHVQLIGLDCHLGSQIQDLEPLRLALRRLRFQAEYLLDSGFPLKHLDMGGGLGIAYRPEEKPPTAKAYVHTLTEALADLGLTIWIEPGRSIVGPSGALLTQVLYQKKTPYKRFCIVDAAMTELLRPALYGAWHNIVPLTNASSTDCIPMDVVGPVCESADVFGKERMLPCSLSPGDILMVQDAGAYGFSMSSTYNTRPRAAEVWVSGDTATLIRSQDSMQQLIQNEFMVS